MILKKKDEITEQNDTVLSRKQNRGTSNDDLNDAVSKWFKLARQQSISVSGPMIQEEAKIIAANVSLRLLMDGWSVFKMTQYKTVYCK